MKPASRAGTVAGVLLAAAALLAVIVVPIVILRTDSPAPEAEPQASAIVAVVGEFRTVPQLAPDRKRALVEDLADVLETLYGRAFLEAGPEPTAAPSPAPTPATRVDDLFTGRARDALRRDPEVFQSVAQLRIRDGRVGFAGIATLDGSKPQQALLDVDFNAEGTTVGGTARVRVRQKGKLLLVAMPYGWRVGGFDLDFSLRPQPSPTPS